MRFAEIRQQFTAFQQRHTFGFCQRAGRVFKAKGPQLLGRRTDKNQSRSLTCLSKGGVFRKKTVARMDRFGSALQRGGDDFFRYQIGL